MSLRWPWVSRRAYDVLDRALVASDTQLMASVLEVKRLTDVITEMKMAGGIFVPTNRERLNAAARAPVVRSTIDQAIDENRFASNNPMLRRHLQGWAQIQLDAGKPEKDVAHRLRTWSVVSEEDDEDGDEDLIENAREHVDDGATDGSE